MMLSLRFLLLFVFLSPLLVYAGEDVSAQKKNDQRPPLASERKVIEDAKALITEIKNKPPFVEFEKEKVWHFKDVDDFELNNNPDLSWLGGVIKFISVVVEASLWLIVVVVAFLIYRYRKYWMRLIQGKKKPEQQSNLPDTLFGLDLREESLPANIEESAQHLWQSQQYRDALSLLYRGALANLFTEFDFNLPAGATEHDCLRYIESCVRKNSASGSLENTTEENAAEENTTENSRITSFKLLTDVWVEVAYAHALPEEEEFLQLCTQWKQAFSKPQGAS